MTDPLNIIATPLDTVPTHQVLNYITDYHHKENIEAFVIGMPKDLKNRDTDSTASVRSFINLLQKKFPDHRIHQIDERFTSKIAMQAMVAGGMKKKERRKKENIDKLSATLILQSYMDAKL